MKRGGSRVSLADPHFVLLAGFGLALWLSQAQPALAHAEKVRADPPDLCGAGAPPPLPNGDPRCRQGLILSSAPGSVSIWFSEAVTPVGHGILVLSPSGQPIEQGTARAVGSELQVPINATALGTYLVSWQVISDDTHPVRGWYVFSVGHVSTVPTAAVAPADIGAVWPPAFLLMVLAHWLHFAGYALAFGPFAFRRFVWHAAGGDEATLRPWFDGLLNTGIIAMIVAGPLAVIAQIVSFGAAALGDPDIVGAVFGSRFGEIVGMQVGAALLLWMLTGLDPEQPSRLAPACLALGLAVAIADSEASHAAGAALAVATQALHIASMAAWLGGLVGLLGVWRRTSDDHHANLLARFGKLAMLSLAVMALTGAILAWLRFPQPASVVHSAYGLAFLAKMAATVGAITLAAIALQRRTERAGLWRLEAGALALALALAGVLASLPPPR
ncbi:MAG: copper resistance protein CopC [Chloroflexota bacterium]